MGGPGLRKVLIVEDNLQVQKFMRTWLQGVAMVSTADTSDQAIKLIGSIPDLSLVAVDYDLGKGDTGIKVIEFLVSKGFSGSIVAISSRDNDKLVTAGATDEVVKDKAPQRLWDLIKNLG